MRKARCRDCHNHITWAELRRQYGRLLNRGLTPTEAKQMLPRCPKCVTAALRRMPTPSNPSSGLL